MPDWVLTTDAVRRAINQLRAQSIHPYFPAYLHLRRQAAAQGSTQDINPEWKQLSPFLEVRDAPPSKPYFRPFTLGSGASDSEWLNPNLAGSFAPSSLGQGQPPPLHVVEVVPGKRGRLNLKSEHWEMARQHLLSDVQMAVWAVAAFMLRDFALQNYDYAPGYGDLEQAFIEVFGYDGPDTPEFEYLYDRGPAHGIDDWFEQFDGGSA